MRRGTLGARGGRRTDRAARRSFGPSGRAVVLAMAIGPALGAACGHSVVRATRKGEFDAAIAAAEARRQPPRGAAARAYAHALSERGRSEQARAVLLSDYRAGGDLRSLVALADLEHALGLDGIAASHYGRAADLSRESLRGRDDVCRLLRRRAGVWAAEGAGLAAERDLRRAERICGLPADEGDAAQLRRRVAAVDAAAAREVDARAERDRCTTTDCDESGAVEEIARALRGAREQGPVALRSLAQELKIELPPADVVTVLKAELRGQAGPALLTDDEVRQMVGEQPWSALAPSVMSRTPVEASYLQLRLASVMRDVPVTLRSRTGPGELDIWLAQSLESSDEHAWRTLAWSGDLAAAEMALAGRWRPKSLRAAGTEGARSAEGASPSPVGSSVAAGVEPPEHWTSRVEPTARNLAALLLEGRIRHAGGHARVGLMIHRHVAARALAAGLPEADRRVAEEAAWHLAHGRPWQALAIARMGAGPRTQPVAAAAATALRLTEAFCGGPCHDDSDLELVERVLGEDWVQRERAQLVARSGTRSRPTTPLDGCPTLGMVLAPDAEGRLADALTRAREQPGTPGEGKRLIAAIEADLGLGCAGRLVLPLLRERGHVASADGLAERLSHDAILDAPRALVVHAVLAMIAGRDQQASLLSTAAASVSPTPARTWRYLARQAHATGLRELTLRCLREALMHRPRLDDAELHRALVLVGLSGVDTDWNLRRTPAGRDEPAAHVRDWVERAEPARRYAVREQLARALAAQPWFDDDARQRLAAALWPDAAVAQAHPVARAWLDLAVGRSLAIDPEDVGPLDLATQELLIVTRTRADLPPLTTVFVEPSKMEPLRYARSERGRRWVDRWRTAIGLATYGTAPARERGLRTLLNMSEADAREALVELVLESPTSIEPSPGGPTEAPLLATPEGELSIVFSLPPDPLGLGPETQTER